MENFTVLFWWFTMSAFSIYNIEKLYYLKYNKNNIIYQSSCLFITTCCIRLLFHHIDEEQVCLFDSWLSYPLIGIFCSSLGEMAFVYQITLITKMIARKFNCFKIYTIMDIVMGLIFIAQIFCWYGVLYKKHLMHIIEESIWMIAIPSIGLSYLYFCKLVNNNLIKHKFIIAFLISISYTLFMMFIYLPMNYNKYNLLFKDTHCKTVTSSYLIWETEIPWITGYFIGATFLSIRLNSFQEFLIDNIF